MDLDFLKTIRLAELKNVLEEVKILKPTHCKLLEIGAGSGWQAKELAVHGHSIEAIDIEQSAYRADRVWDVKTYDGLHMPYENEQFDIVFSSNVLEHIPHIDEFQSEIIRVLKPDGIAIHILPSGSWRFWTNITHYPLICKATVKAIYTRLNCHNPAAQNNNGSENLEIAPRQKPQVLNTLIKASFPERHGEKGNAITEIFHFRKQRWITLFNRTGWDVVKTYPNKLFYTGYMIFGSVLSIDKRRSLSTFLGSSCNVFILSKNSSGNSSFTDTFGGI